MSDHMRKEPDPSTSRIPPTVEEVLSATRSAEPPVASGPPPVVEFAEPPVIADQRRRIPVGWIPAALVATVAVAIGFNVFRSRTDKPVLSANPAEAVESSSNPSELPSDTDGDGENVGSESATEERRLNELSNVKQLGTAFQIYASDYDDCLPYPIENLTLVDPYLKNDVLKRSTLDGQAYKTNRRLSGYPLSGIESPSSEPLIIGPTWPSGDRVVGFADSHAKWILSNPELDGLSAAEPIIPPVGLRLSEPTGVSGFEVERINGQPLLVPQGWKKTHTPDAGSGIETYRWEGPEDEAYIKVDINRSRRSTSLEEGVLKLEQGFKKSSRYRYKRTNWRTGSQAYKDGVIWNFEISKDGAPTHKRGIIYFTHDGVDYAVLVSRRKDSQNDYSTMFTRVWNSAGEW